MKRVLLTIASVWRLAIWLMTIWLMMIVLLRFLPVVFSAVMAERQGNGITACNAPGDISL